MRLHFAEPSDPQRVGPTYELTPTAESDRSRRFAFPALSRQDSRRFARLCRSLAPSPLLPRKRSSSRSIPPALSEPPSIFSHESTPAETMPKKPSPHGSQKVPKPAKIGISTFQTQPFATPEARAYPDNRIGRPWQTVAGFSALRRDARQAAHCRKSHSIN